MVDGAREIELEGQHARLWTVVILTYANNILRAGEARVLHLALLAAVPQLVGSLPKTQAETINALPEPARDALARFGRTTASQYDAYAYVTPLTHLVYYVTLFDTFLQDTIEFLLCLHPASIGESPVPFNRVLRAASRDDILNVAIKAKVRELGFLNFADRLRWLKKHFGLELNLPDPTRSELLHYADVRNTVVHDQGYFDFCLTGRGLVGLRRRTCPYHPTVITNVEVAGAKRAFSDTLATIAEVVFSQVLKEEVPEQVKGVLVALRELHA